MFDELPKKKKIQDFFAEGNPTNDVSRETSREKKTRIPKEKQKLRHCGFYLDTATYNEFKAVCDRNDMKPSVMARHLVVEYLRKQER